ncbi:Unknown protein [Striga hermonthica]|uniref:Uncharacterized protein n=1 Tax=Striga hermonthica TaxID=68872 RepID=A0A9N7MTV2_STRHE|nr:Unknown protein [Striga hermonthica]
MNGKKQGHLTKDEEEVAETLYALASMFSDTNKANQPGSSDDPTSSKLLNGEDADEVEDTPNLSGSKGKLVKLQSFKEAKTPESSSSKQTSRPQVSSELIDFGQATVSGYQNGKNNGKCSFQSPTRTRSCNTNGSSLRVPVWLESTNTEKCTQNTVQSEKSWKRSSAHVYISRLIKVLQIPENREGSLENFSNLSTSGGAHNLTRSNGSRITDALFSGTTHSAANKELAKIEHDVFSNNKTFIQDRQLAQETSALCSSAKEDFHDFLSLGTTSYSDVNKEHIHEAPKQFHAPSYVQQSQKYSGLTTQQVQLPQYLSSSSTVNGSFPGPMDWRPAQYNNSGGVGPANLPDWKNGNTGSPLNCAQALFPHLLGSNQQHFSPQHSQQHIMKMSAISSTLPLPKVEINLRHHQHYQHHNRQFPLGFFERGKVPLYSDNVQQLQLP